MAFRLLRLHGYDVTPRALMNFKKGDEFTCYVGQGFESPSPIFNLYRASQVLFPGESVLEQAWEFSQRFLKQRLQKNQLLDKWLISKHLPNEIKHGLEMPWYAALPRIEARFYLEIYDADEIWIAKSLYRMPEINQEAYLELGKLDFNICQSQHQIEWDCIQDWYSSCALEETGVCKNDLLLAFFLAAATIFEKERTAERMAWAKLQTVSQALLAACDSNEKSSKICSRENTITKLGEVLMECIQDLETEARKWINTEIHELLRHSWEEWLNAIRNNSKRDTEVEELIVRTVNLVGGHTVSKDTILEQEYEAISGITHKICSYLTQKGNKEAIKAIEKGMQLLVQLAFQDSDAISKHIKQSFFMFARTSYYRAFFSTEEIDSHISKILFEKVV